MPVDVCWTSAFLDLEETTHAVGLAFWSGVTGYAGSPARGAHDEFATLLPSTGAAYLRGQRLADGPGRVHLDLHVADPAAAAEVALGLGAEVTARPAQGYLVLSSPAGIAFCLVPHRASRRPAPAPGQWNGPHGGHRSVVDQVALDLAARDADPEIAFWRRLTGWEHRVSSPVYSALLRADGQPLRLMFHRVGDDRSPATAHLDLACEDRVAETERHVALGARVRDVTEHFTVLLDPTGAAYCVTDRDPGTGLLKP